MFFLVLSMKIYTFIPTFDDKLTQIIIKNITSQATFNDKTCDFSSREQNCYSKLF